MPVARSGRRNLRLPDPDVENLDGMLLSLGLGTLLPLLRLRSVIALQGHT
jgi:hypothetical protein